MTGKSDAVIKCNNIANIYKSHDKSIQRRNGSPGLMSHFVPVQFLKKISRSF